jgi:hypothetical protein
MFRRYTHGVPPRDSRWRPLFVHFQSVPSLVGWAHGRNKLQKSCVGFEYDEEVCMAQHQPGSSGYLGALLGGLVAVVAITFMLSGGEWTGNKKIDGDDDLPPVVSTAPK